MQDDEELLPAQRKSDTRSATHSRTSTSQQAKRPQSRALPTQDQHPGRFETISVDNEGARQSQSQDRPASKAGGKHLRASITQEYSTQQDAAARAKVDNCVSKFAFATKTGFSPSNPYKVNQDSFLAMPHLGEYRRTHFFAVLDGHGVFGKEVSEYVKTQLGQRTEVLIKQIFDNAKQMQRVVDSNEVKDALASSFGFVT